jgi:hypothetical protein
MNGILISIGIIFIIFIGLLIFRCAKGPAYTLSSIELPIKGLLKQGYDGGFLIITISYSKKFIQLRKYINSPGVYGIEMHFPNAKWSSELFEKMKNYCERYSVDYSILIDYAKNKEMEFICVDFKKNAKKAHDFVKGILRESFRVGKNVKLFTRLENATIEDRLIDS